MSIRKLLIFNTFALLFCCLSIGDLSAQQTDSLATERIDFSKAPRKYVVGKVTAPDMNYIHKEYLINMLNLTPGDSITIPGDKIKDAYRKLWELRNFSDVKIETTLKDKDTVDIYLNLTPYKRVSQWSFLGVPTNEAKDLREKLRVRRYGEYSDFILNNSMRLIREYYDEKAFRNAKISYDIMADTSKFGDFKIDFKIEKGKKVRIGEIKVEGNNNVSTKGIDKAMKNTNKVNINFFAKTKFNAKEFKDDIKSAESFMHSKGYRDAVVVADSLYKINEKRIGVWMKVEEGKKYYFRNISWIGNSVYPNEELEMLLQLKKGDVYDSEAIRKRLGTGAQADPTERSVATMYRNAGYLAYTIEPIETVVGGDSIDIDIRMIEGNQFRVNDVKFSGNTRTNDHVIRRELFTDPGELYDQSLLMRSYQRLATMGQFDPQSITPEPIPNLINETVDIQYTFKETPNDQLELSGGWGGGMFIASVGLNFTNFAVRKFFDMDSWKPYPAGDNQTLSLKLQSNGTYYQAFSVSFTEPWVGGKKPNSLSVSFFTSRQSNASFVGQVATQYFGTTGASVTFGKRLRWPDPFFTMSAGISLQAYNLTNWDSFIIKNGHSNTVALNFMVGRNSVDDPYQYPTRGSNISLSLAITPPFSSFDGQDYSNQKMSEQDRYRWIEYHKWKANLQWYFPLSSDNKLVLMARGQFGYLGYFNENKKSPFEGFIVGGDGLSGYSVYGTETVGLRGYTNGSLTPYSNSGRNASVYSKYVAELRYPFLREGSTMVYGIAFMEAGNAFENVKDFKPFNLKRSAGVGVRIFLPVLGMLGIDWGYGFDKANSTATGISGSQFHFSIGAQF